MNPSAIQIPAIQNLLNKWEEKKRQWLLKTGTTFTDHFDQDLYERIKIAKQLKTQNNK